METDQLPREVAAERKPKFLALPRTRMGWQSVVLAGAFLLALAVLAVVSKRLPKQPWWLTASAVLPVLAVTMIGTGLGAGISCIVAMLRDDERSWLVCVPPMLAALLTIIVLAAEFLGG